MRRLWSFRKVSIASRGENVSSSSVFSVRLSSSSIASGAGTTLAAMGYDSVNVSTSRHPNPSRHGFSNRIVPLTAEDIRGIPRMMKRFVAVINSRSFVNSLLQGCGDNNAKDKMNGPLSDEEYTRRMGDAMERLVPVLSTFVYDLGIPLAVEQLAELFVPCLVFAGDEMLGRPSKGSVLLLDDMEAGCGTVDGLGHLYHEGFLSEEGRGKCEGLIADWIASGDFVVVPARLEEVAAVVDNEAFDSYFEVLLKALTEHGPASGLFTIQDNDGRAYTMPGTSEYFMRRLYPCVRKDSYKSLWHACLSAGWTGFGRSRMSDVEVLEAYFNHIHSLLGDSSPIEIAQSDLVNGAGDGSLVVRRRQDDHTLPSVNELARFSRFSALPHSPPPPPPPAPPAPISPSKKKDRMDGVAGSQFTRFVVPPSSPLSRLHMEVVLPQAHRVQTRGLSTLLAFLQSERALLANFDTKTPYELIALATRLSTPSFVLEVLAACPSKRAKDPTLGPLPSWCFPLYAGYFVGGDDMKGIAEMHVRAAVKTVLQYDTSDNDIDSLRNACLELKKDLFRHHPHLSGMHAHVLLCSFRFMQKHEQLHRALKKSIVAGDDSHVKASRIKEITGNVLNSLTELEYCINANLMHIPTAPLAPGRRQVVEEPEEIKLAKADALYRYWYLDWLASHC